MRLKSLVSLGALALAASLSQAAIVLDGGEVSVTPPLSGTTSFTLPVKLSITSPDTAITNIIGIDFSLDFTTPFPTNTLKLNNNGVDVPNATVPFTAGVNPGFLTSITNHLGLSLQTSGHVDTVLGDNNPFVNISLQIPTGTAPGVYPFTISGAGNDPLNPRLGTYDPQSGDETSYIMSTLGGSITVLPEPSSLGMLCLGGATLLRRNKRKTS